MLGVLVGGPGIVALIVAIIGFLQNRRTLAATQPKTEAEKMSIDIANLRALLEESRQTRAADKQDFEYRIAELKAQLKEQAKQYEKRIDDLLRRVEEYLDAHTIARPHWLPARKHRDSTIDSPPGDDSGGDTA